MEAGSNLFPVLQGHAEHAPMKTASKYSLPVTPELWMVLIVLVSCLAFPAGMNSQELAQPSSSEQAAILDKVKDYAEQYVASLPDFICDQVVEQSRSGKNGKHPRRGDTLTSKLVYSEQRERRTLETVNGKPVGPDSRRPHSPLVTEGEFGILLSNIVSSSSEAKFQWIGWETLEQKRMANFSYAIDKEHSTLKLSLSFLAHAVLPYQGTITADPETGAVWRITNSADDIPPEIKTKSISTKIEYARVGIGGTQYLLPVRASVSSITNNDNLRNEMRFENYRKFTANSTLIVAPESNQQH